MKKINLLFVMLLFTATSILAQVPNAINFQAIARDANGDVMANTTIMIQLTILDGSATGTNVYQEIRSLTTNGYGSFSFQIGVDPYMNVGDFDAIEWETGNKYMKVDYDPTASLNFDLTLGTIEFVTVPYAFAAGAVSYIDLSGVQDGDVLLYNSATGKFEPGQVSGGTVEWSNIVNVPNFAPVATSGDYNDLLNLPTLFDGQYSSLTGTPAIPTDLNELTDIDNLLQGGFSGSYNDLTDLPTLFDGNYNSLSNLPTLFSGNYNDLANKPDFTGWDTDASDDFDGAWSNLTGTAPNVSTFVNDANYLTNFTELDPSYTTNFDLTGTATGDLLKFDGSKFVKFTPNYLTNFTEIDGSITNEIQTLSVTGNDLTISGTGGNTIALPASGNIQAVTRAELDALTPEVGELAYNTTDEVTVMWNGTNWIQISDNCFPQPTQANAGGDQTISTTVTSVTLAANTPVEGTGTWSIISGTGGSFTNANDPTTTFTGTSCTDYTLQWEIATACTQTTDNVSISFSANPTAANAGADIYSPTQVTVTLAGNNPTIGTGVWSIESGSGGSFSNPNNYNSNFTGNDNTTYVLRWTTNTACNISYDELKVYIGNVVGQYKNGGVIFYVDGTGLHGLVCAVSDQSTNAEWGCYGTVITGADGTAIGTGSQNTTDIEAGCTTAGTAADICANLTLNSHSDWFLPSKDELNLMHQNRAEINTSATNNGGSNFALTYYWSSTEYNGDSAWLQSFSYGGQNASIKGNGHQVRAVRAF